MDPRAAGTNGLLKDGATLVTNARDVLDELNPVAGRNDVPTPPQQLSTNALEEPPDSSSMPPPLECDRTRVLDALSPAPVAVDDLIRHTGINPAQLMLILLELDLAGRLERHAGGSVSFVVHHI
jgi:DNA processing protein